MITNRNVLSIALYALALYALALAIYDSVPFFFFLYLLSDAKPLLNKRIKLNLQSEHHFAFFVKDTL